MWSIAGTTKTCSRPSLSRRRVSASPSVYLTGFFLADGVNIDNWTFHALTRAVEHFIRAQEPGYIEADDDILKSDAHMDQQERDADEHIATSFNETEKEAVGG
jgi:hypothetical protein